MIKVNPPFLYSKNAKQGHNLENKKYINIANSLKNVLIWFFSDVATNEEEEEDENGIFLQMKPVKSYKRAKPLNASITASPPKKMKKKVHCSVGSIIKLGLR